MRNIVISLLATILLGTVSSFASVIIPTDVSEAVSTITPAYQVVDGLENGAVISVFLKDDMGEPVLGHEVRLIDSVAHGDIEYIGKSNVSDSNGKVSFYVTAGKESAVTYTAYDVTANVMLNDRAEVAYFDSYSSFMGAGSMVDHFEFDDVDETVYVADQVSATITAYDSLDQIVTDYLGTVEFSVISNNENSAVLPADYTFTVSDLGNHTFSLSFIFQQEGAYLVEVRDTTDLTVFGEYVFEVLPTEPGAVTSGIIINNPIPGTYSNNIQVVSGTASAGTDLKIFDNDLPLGNATADINGHYSFTTGLLADGEHEIYVAEVNDVGTILDTSNVIEITIDTGGADISNLILEPSTPVEPNSSVNVKLYSADALSSVSLVFEGNVYPLSENVGGYFEGVIGTPSSAGQYPLSFKVVDALGHETNFDNYAVLNVKAPTTTTTTADFVGDVSGLKAFPYDKKVVLEWDKAVADKGVTHYRVYYGTSASNLSDAIDTFTDSTTWYIPNLNNDVTYYFAVVAVDWFGSISEHFSNIVEAVPGPQVVDVDPCVAAGTCDDGALEDMEEDASEAGPEVIWLLFLSVIGGFGYMQASKRKAVLLYSEHE